MDKKYNGSSAISDKKNLWFCNMLPYLVLRPGFCSKLNYFKQPWSCPFLKFFSPQCERACGGPDMPISEKTAMFQLLLLQERRI